MPRLSVLMVRVSMLYLGIGFTVGALMLYNKANPVDPQIWRMLPAHIDLLLLGWTQQLGMGVAFWILPRLPGERKYGRVTLAWAAFLTLNAGLALVILSPWLLDKAEPVIFAGRAAEVGSAVLFAVYCWPRIKGFGAASRTG